MASVLYQELRKLASRRRPKQSRVVLLLEHARLNSDVDTIAGHVLEQEGDIAGAVHIDQQAAVDQAVRLDFGV